MFPAFIFQIVIVLLVVGVLLWAIQQFPAIDPAIVRIVRVLVVVCVCIWVLYLLMGLFGGMPAPVLRR
jgi:hypothetical protein